MWIRRVVIGLVGLALVVAGLLAWLVMGFDANRYKGVVVEWMKTHHSRTLAINGPIGLSVFPRLQLTLADVSLSEAGRGDEFAAIERAELAVEVLPLLGRELVIGRIAARGVRAAYLRDAKGVSNIDDLLKPPADADPAASPGSRKPPRLNIDGIALENLALRIRDQTAGIEGEVQLASLNTGRVQSQTETPVDWVVRLDLKSPAVRGELRGDTRLTLDLDTGSARVQGLNLSFNGDAAGATAIRAQIKGSGGWNAETAAVDAQGLQLALAATQGGLKIDTGSLGIERFAYGAAAKELRLGQLKLQLAGTQDGQPLTFALDWPELSVTGDRLQGSAFSGRLARGGPAALEAAFKSGAPTGGFDAIALPGVEATVSSRSGARRLDATLRADLRLKPPAAPKPASLALDALTVQGQIENPGLQPLKVQARGKLQASPERADWTLAGDLNGAAFNTDGQANLAGAVPRITAQARFDTLDLNRLLDSGPATAASAPAAPAPAGGTPVDLSGLRSVDGRFSLQAGSLAYQRYRVAAARIDATLDGGVLQVSALQGRIWGGSVDASARAEAANGRVAMKGTASGIDIAAALRDVADKQWMDGTGRVTMDIDATGRTVEELKSKLHGRLALQLRDGAINGINLAKTLRTAKAAITQRTDAVQKANETEKTDFSELSASFQIADGVARSNDLDVKSPFLRLGGEGAVDIGRGRIDYLARATVTGTSQGQDGADLAALKGLQVPVRLSGPFESLDWKVEWSAVLAGALTQTLKNQVQDRLEEKLGLKPATPTDPNAPKQKPKDALKDVFKGLLK